jgi:hypothetical protein
MGRLAPQPPGGNGAISLLGAGGTVKAVGRRGHRRSETRSASLAALHPGLACPPTVSTSPSSGLGVRPLVLGAPSMVLRASVLLVGTSILKLQAPTLLLRAAILLLRSAISLFQAPTLPLRSTILVLRTPTFPLGTSIFWDYELRDCYPNTNFGSASSDIASPSSNLVAPKHQRCRSEQQFRSSEHHLRSSPLLDCRSRRENAPSGGNHLSAYTVWGRR